MIALGIYLLVLAGLLLAALAAVPRGTRWSVLAQRLLTGLLLADFIAGALFLRINFAHHVVFGEEWVKFTGVDAYWHIRIVDNLAAHFPFMSSADPYLLYPGGGGTSLNNPFFDYLLAGIVWIAGLGSPTQHTVDTIGPYLPTVLGALTIFPAFFIGRALGGRWAGLFAAGVMAIIPGEFLGRSLLGFTDHHVAEALFAATAVMFLVLALATARKEEMTLDHLRHPRQRGTAGPLAWGALGGLFLGLLLASWEGALLLVFIIAAFLAIQFVADHVRGVPTDYLGLVGGAAFLVALVVFVSLGQGGHTWLVLLLAVLLPAALFALSRLMAARSLAGWAYPAVVAGVGLAVSGIAYGADRPLMNTLLEHFTIFRWNTGTSVSEMVPLLLQPAAAGGGFDAGRVWETYGYSLVLAGVSLCLLAYQVVRRWEAERVLVLVWTVVLLAATLAQRRFAYYLAVNISVLAGYAAWQVLRVAGLPEDGAAPAGQPEPGRRGEAARRPASAAKARKAKRKKKAPASVRLKDLALLPVLAAVLLFCLLTVIPYGAVDRDGTGRRVATSTIQFDQVVAQPRYYPPDAWCESLTWMRNQTPEPFGDPDYYYARYSTPLDYSAFPDAYSVMAWWDYGYWIVRIGHRPPAQNPGGAIPGVAAFFLSQDEAAAGRIMDEYGARYVVLDYEFLMWKLYGAAEKTGQPMSNYYDDFWFRESGSSGGSTLRRVTLYFPAYYRSMSVRLYMFGGQAVTPAADQCQVVSWKWATSNGVQYRLITSQQGFDTYEQAQAFLADKSPEEYTIAGTNPFVSPVPLEKLADFAPVHDSTVLVTLTTAGDKVPQIRIFEYASR